eukprot:727290-Pyramimonas_sp.AAC.1
MSVSSPSFRVHRLRESAVTGPATPRTHRAPAQGRVPAARVNSAAARVNSASERVNSALERVDPSRTCSRVCADRNCSCHSAFAGG